MTVTQLIKELQKIQEKHPRALVVGEADTFTDGDYTHGLVNSVDTKYINWTEGDGTVYNKDGSEHQRFVVVLSGH